ncbi:hypothetical protein TNIN_341181 [Trichonephila inaurata madagascariensis]|uniref:Uncharacterized protein n=1 Tax=Trichonephila inaurata madagascariensis TaxID=2747483 RepID=A0A8X6YH29_9ARAC|nr:hypothetical protein TNIN_341181 [Trichonephila inaurata madagascariensis]
MGVMDRHGRIESFKCQNRVLLASVPCICQKRHLEVTNFTSDVSSNTCPLCRAPLCNTPNPQSGRHHVESQKNGRMVTGKEHSSELVIILPFFGFIPSPTLAEKCWKLLLKLL